MLATCIQHEVDHLNGVLFIDYLSKLKKDMIIKKLKKQKKRNRSNCYLISMALKIIFTGNPEFSVPILDSIYQSNHKIIEVYTQPPTKKNRGQKVHLSPVHTFAKKNNIPVRHPNQINTNDELEHI